MNLRSRMGFCREIGSMLNSASCKSWGRFTMYVRKLMGGFFYVSHQTCNLLLRSVHYSMENQCVNVIEFYQ